MAPALLYSTCVLGAVGLYLIIRSGRRSWTVAGSLLGLGVAAWLLAGPAGLGRDPAARPEPFFLIFSFIALAAAVRMISHHRPVYSALYFILVVLSSAGLFLLLEAEFMAFALIIVYAGAILITYVFVLMLAQQSATGDDPHGQPLYDLVPREPAAAALVGFVMLALLTGMIEGGDDRLEPRTPGEIAAGAWAQLERMPERLDAEVRALAPEFRWPAGGRNLDWNGAEAWVTVLTEGAGEPVRLALPASAMPENVQLVGLALVSKFPVSLELAGVILLMAMFGAVVLARRQIELGEDEIREAAGIPSAEYETGRDGDPTEPPAGGAS